MKKYLYIVLFFLGVILINYSCNKEEVEKDSMIYVYEKTQRNEDYNNLAKIVSVALTENSDFRKIIKQEVLLKFDGDYDVLLSVIKDKTFVDDGFNEQKSLGKSKRIGTFLSSYVDKLNIDIHRNQQFRGSAQDYIDQLAQEYPTMQISVPVHADEWTDGFVPKVTFVPKELQESRDVDIIAYQNNTATTVNAKNEPTEPVVVISDNERIGNSGGGIFVIPAVFNWVLQGARTQSGIRLNWTANVAGQDVIGYHIYRKGTSNSSFVHIGDSYGINNMTYDDNITLSLEWYNYYVTAFNPAGESNISNIINIQAPDVPLPVDNFSATLNTPNDLELRWDNPQNQYIDYTLLSKKVIGVDNTYNEIARLDRNTHNYVDVNVIPGNTIVYQANEVDNNGTSNSKYDIVKVPYRDVSQATKVYIEKIEFDYSKIDEIEGWFRGAPEFKIAVAMGNPGSGVKIRTGMMFQFNSRHSWNNFNSRNVYDWLPSDWGEILTFSAIEVDGGPDVDLNLGAEYTKKNALGTGLAVNGSVNVKFEDFLDSEDENLGNAILKYYDTTTKWITFDSFGFKIKISTDDVIETSFP